MNVAETQKRILESSDFVLAEVAKLQFLYGLKREIRYGASRDEEIETESVAEHVYGMHILSGYFLPLEDNGDFDVARILSMIIFHDIDEIVVGDTIGYLKTDAHREREKDAMGTVLHEIPDIMEAEVAAITAEYEAQESIESRFVKALDKIEPLIHLYNENGKTIVLRNGTTRADSHKIKDKYVEEFPYMRQFNAVMNEQMDKDGFFSPQLPLGDLSK